MVDGDVPVVAADIVVVVVGFLDVESQLTGRKLGVVKFLK